MTPETFIINCNDRLCVVVLFRCTWAIFALQAEQPLASPRQQYYSTFALSSLSFLFLIIITSFPSLVLRPCRLQVVKRNGFRYITKWLSVKLHLNGQSDTSAGVRLSFRPQTSGKHLSVCPFRLGFPVPGLFSNPVISGLESANPGIPGLGVNKKTANLLAYKFLQAKQSS